MDMEFTWSGDAKNALNLSSGFINSEKQLIFSGANSRASMVFSYAADISFVTDEPEIDSDFDGIITTSCYSLNSNLWWHISGEEWFSSLGNIYGASSSNFGTSTLIRDINATYYMFGPPNQTSSTTIWPKLVMKTVGQNNTSYRDFDTNTETQVGYYTFIYQTNKNWFGTEKRKFTHKLKVIANNPIRSTDSVPNHIKVIYARDGDYTSDPTPQIRTIALSTTPRRLYWNNLGAFRKQQFCIVGKIKDQFTMDAIEMDLSQGAF